MDDVDVPRERPDLIKKLGRDGRGRGCILHDLTNKHAAALFLFLQPLPTLLIEPEWQSALLHVSNHLPLIAFYRWNCIKVIDVTHSLSNGHDSCEFFTSHLARYLLVVGTRGYAGGLHEVPQRFGRRCIVKIHGGLNRFFAMADFFFKEERAYRADVLFSKKSLSAMKLKGTTVYDVPAKCLRPGD
jgi:hypothetical protein